MHSNKDIDFDDGIAERPPASLPNLQLLRHQGRVDTIEADYRTRNEINAVLNNTVRVPTPFAGRHIIS